MLVFTENVKRRHWVRTLSSAFTVHFKQAMLSAGERRKEWGPRPCKLVRSEAGSERVDVTFRTLRGEVLGGASLPYEEARRGSYSHVRLLHPLYWPHVLAHSFRDASLVLPGSGFLRFDLARSSRSAPLALLGARCCLLYFILFFAENVKRRHWVRTLSSAFTVHF